MGVGRSLARLRSDRSRCKQEDCVPQDFIQAIYCIGCCKWQVVHSCFLQVDTFTLVPRAIKILPQNNYITRTQSQCVVGLGACFFSLLSLQSHSFPAVTCLGYLLYCTVQIQHLCLVCCLTLLFCQLVYSLILQSSHLRCLSLYCARLRWVQPLFPHCVHILIVLPSFPTLVQVIQTFVAVLHTTEFSCTRIDLLQDLGWG